MVVKGPTYCENCDFVHMDTRKQPYYRQLCVKHPRVATKQFVVESNELSDPPYLRCEIVNGGFCYLFEPRKGD